MVKRFYPPGTISAPTDLVVVAIGGYQVILAWTKLGNSALGVRIERAAGNDPCGPFVEVGGVGPHVTAFRDETVKPRMTYSYRVHAWDASGFSQSSNVVVVTSPQPGTDPSAE